MAEPWILILKNPKEMKKYIAIITLAILSTGLFSSCWKEDIPEAGAARHIVENLTTTPGDEEVVLSWTMPEGFNPDSYIIFYNDVEQNTVKLTAECPDMTYTVTELVNEFTYNFNVQAVYGTRVSNPVLKSCKPTTSRFAVKNLQAETEDQTVTLTWEKPSTLVTGYTITYFMAEDESNVKTEEAGKDEVEKVFTGLTNDKNYTFTIVAHYAKGDSEPVEIKAMPALAIPYFISNATPASGQPVTYTFNTEGYPDAQNVKWTFPDKVVKEGTEVTYGFLATGEQVVKLSAEIKGKKKEWNVPVTLREWVVEFYDLDKSSAYNGFKGSRPALSPDGKTAYVITFNSPTVLYAIDLTTGEQKWKYAPTTASKSYNPLSVNPVTGDIYFGTSSAGQLYCVTPDGNLKWNFTGAASMNQAPSPVISADGNTIYIVDAEGNTFAINALNGQKIWSKALGAIGSAIMINNNDLIVGVKHTASENLFFLNTENGDEIAKLQYSFEPITHSGFAVADDKKTAYWGLKGGIGSFDLSTRKKIAESATIAGDAIYSPVVSSDGYVFGGSKDGKVYCLKADLSEVLWSAGPAVKNTFNFCSPCADTEGNVYITSGQGLNVNYKFKAATGEEVSKYSYGSDANQKQMGGNNYHDGVLYSLFIGGGSENGRFIGKYVGGTRKFWGGPCGDICCSGCVQSPLLK